MFIFRKLLKISLLEDDAYTWPKFKVSGILKCCKGKWIETKVEASDGGEGGEGGDDEHSNKHHSRRSSSCQPTCTSTWFTAGSSCPRLFILSRLDTIQFET